MDILSNFQGSQVVPFFVSDGKITDIDKAWPHLDPEILMVFLSGLKILQDFFYNMDAGRGVAVAYVSADNRFHPGEDPFLALGKIFDISVLIDKGYIHRKRIEDLADPLKREA